MQSIKQVSEQLESDLKQYLESSYHLHHPRLLKERRELMNEDEISTEPWVEATPSYVAGENLRNLQLPDSVSDLLKDLEADGLDVFDPPYKHQADALEAFFDDKQDLIVSTGTGSGKTEIFLYSILGQIAQESARGRSTEQRGIRTLVLYPMNALVADQLSRMRLMFGDKDGADTLEEYMGRRVQFGMYTSRTPYHGEFDTDKNARRLKPIINRYLDLRREKPELYTELKKKGRIPAKNLEGFRNEGARQETQFQTQPGDCELFTRQEMHTGNEYGGTPDILITNYSMLEYMLMRPIEQPLFEDTRQWLEEDKDNEITVVLDEAHLYRGAQGAEVALLLSRLLQKLGISRDRVRFILTSATMGENIESAAPEFAAQLTTGQPEEFAVITGEQETFGSGTSSDQRTAEILSRIEYGMDNAKIRNLATERGWDPLDTTKANSTLEYLADQLQEDSLFHLAHEHLRDNPLQLDDLANILFPGIDQELAQEATGNLLYLCTEADRGQNQSLLPTRLHMFLKGLPAQYACVNPECSGRRITEGENLLGRIYTNPHTTCPECDSRVFELLSHRTCGAAYLRAYRRSGDTHNPTFLWTDPESTEDLDELHLLVEQPRGDDDPTREDGRSLRETTQSRKLDISSGYMVDKRRSEEGDPDQYIDVWVPIEKPPEEDYPWSWTRCPVCGIEERLWNGQTKIQDLVTKGEEPFANIVRSMFGIQPEDNRKNELPNKGKKVLCFSDGRQKAARLARDLQGNVELDSFREVVTDIIGDASDELSMDRFFAEFAVYCRKKNILFFDDRDEYNTQDGVDYPGSRTRFQDIQKRLPVLVERYGLDSIDDIPGHQMCQQEISNRPQQYNSVLLKSLGDEYFSIPAALIGYVRPVQSVIDELENLNPSVNDDLLYGIVVESLQHACQERAFDNEIDRYQRNSSLPYGWMSEDEEGIKFTELIPEHVDETVGKDLTEDQWQTLKNSLLQTSTPLFMPLGNGNQVVNPAATTIQLELDGGWYRCEGCYRFSAVTLNGVCPHKDCSGSLVELPDDDIHREARKDYLRNPPYRVVHEDRDPFTLRSEEHSAQLNAKDFSEPFSKSEVYELLFQDILVGDAEAEQPIDVLSCTTTMEVGIDIGSLTGVAMRTVPPAPENYEQRAGRAGRRGVGLSTIVTFADNSPHESHYFQHPEKMIGAKGTEPIIYSGNKKIARRHINASLLARFFDPGEVESGADVFRSLGTAADFFEGDGRHTFQTFEDWMKSEVLGDVSTRVKELGELLPAELGEGETGNWRTDFIQETGETFLTRLRDLEGHANWSEDTNPDEDLLSTLLDNALLPTFSFPIDVCDFVVEGSDRETGQPKTKYEMSRDLKQALSTYVPGREIVVDKKTFESYGTYFKFAEDPVNRASGVDWGGLDWLNFCPRCETVFDEEEDNLGDQEITCSVCGEETLQSVHQFTPTAFAPEINEAGRPEESEGRSDERIYATPPKYPLTPTSEQDEFSGEMNSTKGFGPSTVGRMSDEQLLVANLGPSQEGFDVCMDCGAVDKGGNLGSAHNRPYPKNIRQLSQVDKWPDKCNGDTVRTSFSHTFPSDLTVFRIPLNEPMRFVPDADWFDSAAQSLSEALVMGASRALGIESDELEGGYRTRSADLAEDPDVRGFIEVFLFDTTAGGAGFSSKVWEEFNLTLQETQSILSDCSCDSACHNCLRAYQNRHLHSTLNRHQGLALFEYATTGDVPSPEVGKIQTLVDQLERSLRLQKPGAKITQPSTAEDVWQVQLNEFSLVFGVRSCLRESRSHESKEFEKDYSDFELSNQLPSVAYELMDQLE